MYKPIQAQSSKVAAGSIGTDPGRGSIPQALSVPLAALGRAMVDEGIAEVLEGMEPDTRQARPHRRFSVRWKGSQSLRHPKSTMWLWQSSGSTGMSLRGL